MSEKWIQRSNMVSDGRGVAYYGRTVRDARGFFELLVSAQVGLRALTSERDEAVRVAGELREIASDLFDELGPCQLTDGAAPFCLSHHSQHPCVVMRRRKHADSLTASTGGSSDEPQKEIRE